MARFGFVGPSYTSQSVNADNQRCMNFYPETMESGAGKSSLVLYPTPGLSIFVTIASPVRGFSTINGRTFAVGGPNLYEILTNGTATNLGTIANDNLLVSMAASTTQLLIASAGLSYVLTLATNALTPIPSVTFTGPVSLVGYSDGFFLALIANSEKFYVSNPLDATTWQGGNSTIVSVFPDNVLSMLVDHREIWLFGSKATVPYYDSGNLFPYDVVPGGFLEQGCIAKLSPAKLDNTVFWLGGDERGSGIVWRSQGYSPQRVSNHAVEFALQGYTTISDAIGYSYQDQGHSFYVLYFPTASKTWVYDVATGLWHERGYWNATNGIFTAHKSQCHTFNFGKHLVGDWSSGNVYSMSIASLDDFGNPIRRVRRAPHIASEQEWIFHHQLQVDFETGLGPLPPLIGSGPLLTITLKDANNSLWTVSVLNNGTLQTTAGSLAAAQTITLNDIINTVSWQLGITIGGILTTTSVAFSAINAATYQLCNVAKAFLLGVTTGGLLQTSDNSSVFLGRGPQAMLRWSDDGGHSWSNEYTVDCGQAGNYKKRAIWRRLGRSRDRVYELSVSDAIPWRIVDAYLQATPGFQPSERISSQFRKVS